VFGLSVLERLLTTNSWTMLDNGVFFLCRIPTIFYWPAVTFLVDLHWYSTNSSGL